MIKVRSLPLSWINLYYPGGPDIITTVLIKEMQVGESHRRRRCDDGSRGWSDELGTRRKGPQAKEYRS